MANAIERLTGHRPPTCPWRAMHDPLVGPVIDAASLADKGLGMWGLDDDPPAILVDAMTVYLKAREAVSKHDDAEDHKKRMSQIKKH